MTKPECRRALRRGVLGALVGGVLLGPRAIIAQSCLGLPSLNEARGSISVGADGTGPSRTVLSRIGIASEHSFIGLQNGLSGVEFASLRHLVWGADVGRVLSVGSSGATTLCPVLQARRGYGRQGGIYDTHTASASLGLALGHTMKLGASRAITPFAQAAVVHASGNSRPSIVTGQLSVGFGLRVHERFTLTPSYGRPVRYGSNVFGMDETYSLSVSFVPRGRAPR